MCCASKHFSELLLEKQRKRLHSEERTNHNSESKKDSVFYLCCKNWSNHFICIIFGSRILLDCALYVYIENHRIICIEIFEVFKKLKNTKIVIYGFLIIILSAWPVVFWTNCIMLSSVCVLFHSIPIYYIL